MSKDDRVSRGPVLEEMNPHLARVADALRRGEAGGIRPGTSHFVGDVPPEAGDRAAAIAAERQGARRADAYHEDSATPRGLGPPAIDRVLALLARRRRG